MYYSDKVVIKRIQNGWLVGYEEWDIAEGYSYKMGENELAFTYDFKDERVKVWNKLVQFLVGELTEPDLGRQLYPEKAK